MGIKNVTVHSQDFFNSWMKSAFKHRDRIDELWNQKREYTNLVISNPDSIIVEIGKELDFTVFNANYYFLDAVMYDWESDRVSGIPDHNTYLHYIRVAFEHENSFNWGLFAEVSHLLITNCDVKVLVSYPNGDRDEKLPWLHEMIKRHPDEAKLSDGEGFLLILGYGRGKHWEGWVYKSDHWKRLPNPYD
jgi:hypothetical protein